MKGSIRRLVLVLFIGYSLSLPASLVWGDGAAYTPEQYNALLESYGVKLVDPQKCPSQFVTVNDGKTIFGTTYIAYSPEGYNAMLEAYGLKLTDPSKCPANFVTVTEKEGKKEYAFGGPMTAYSSEEFKDLLQAYGVKISK